MDLEDAVTAVARAATRSGRTVAVAESLTCGAIVSALGRGDDAQDWLKGGVVAYRTEVKVGVLGVPEGTDPCSAACAEQLARGVRDLLGADVAVAVTGVGGPDPQDGHPPGTVHLGASSATRTSSRELRFGGEPEEVVERTVVAALTALAGLLAAS